MAELDQPSAKWTLALLLQRLEDDLSPVQQDRATQVLERNLETCDDWIVQINTMTTLAGWAANDAALRDRLVPHLVARTRDRRRSVHARAEKLLATLD